jgi:protein gp37
MSIKSKIEWCDSTFNPWIGCTKVSPGCDHCYAERQMDQRLGRVQWGAGKPRRPTSVAYWRQPVQWNARADVFRECGACGWRGDLALRDDPVAFACPSCDVTDWRPARRRVFCASLADVFDNEAPAEWRFGLLNLIAGTPHLDWLVLTKRIGNAKRMLDDYIASDGHTGETWDCGWPNLWLGATVCNQQEFDRDVPKLLETPAAVRFLSCEPLLGPVDMDCVPRPASWPEVIDDISDGIHPLRYLSGPHIDWVIAGGESGPAARPAHPDWFRSMRDECVAARVPFFFKQWGGWYPAGRRIFEARMVLFGGEAMYHIGKRAAGRLLDGRTWNELPRSAA